ncbi:MAG: hypothetical protein QM778_25120 [Myxococcales bacterium]
MTIEPLAPLLLGLCLSCVGCTTPAQQASVYLEQTKIPPELKLDFECFAVNCSKCHQLARALNAPITRVEHWNRYVARMARTPGSGISPAEAPSILRFLHWHTQERVRAEQAENEREQAESERKQAVEQAIKEAKP